MTTTHDAQELMGRTAVDSSGEKIGKVGQIYLDDRTGEPTWVTVKTGMFGSKESFAPLAGATSTGDGELRLAVTKDEVKDAPNIDDDGHIGDDEPSTLYDYYHRALSAGSGTGRSDTVRTGEVADSRGGRERAGGEVGGPGSDISGPNTDDAMTRSEERVNVGTQNVESGRARLRKYVVTENVTQTVPVSHEEVRVEREPITDANHDAATSGPAISEEEHEVTLHAERPVVDKEAVPVERVRMGTETVTDEERISEEVRKERVDVDEDADRTR